MKLLWRAAFICALGIGLVSVFQNCSPVQFQNAPFEQNSQLTTSNCTPNDSISCRIPNGEGTSRCNLEGNGWSSCELTRCDHGYSAQNGQCIRTPCNNGAVNPPQCNQCASGNILNNQGQCVARICSPGTTRGCVIPNGQGQETCNSQGTGWGACQIISCNSNYVQQGNQCVTATCSNGASNPPQCTQCSVGQSMVNGRCQAHVCSPNSSRDCSVANGQGRQVCRSDGSGWDSCQVTNCNAGYSNQNNVCVVSTCSNGANNPPACTTCPSGQSLINGQCRTLVCTPNSSQSCTIPNGQGQQQCNSQGTGWNTCQVVSCNTGYQLVGNSCAPEPTVTIITGTAYCVEYWNGTMWTCGDNRIGSSNNRESWVYIGSAGPGYSSRTPGGCEPGHTQRKQLRNVNGALIGFTCERDFPQSQVPSNRISGVAYCDPNKFKGWGGQDCGTYGSNFNPTTSTWQAYLAANPAGPLNPVCTDGATPIGILYSVNQQGQTGGISGFACVRGSLPVHNHWQPGPISSPSSGSTGGSGSGGSSPSAQPSNACQLNFITPIDNLRIDDNITAYISTTSAATSSGQRNRVYEANTGALIGINDPVADWGVKQGTHTFNGIRGIAVWITPYLMNYQAIRVRWEMMENVSGVWRSCNLFRDITWRRPQGGSSCRIPEGYKTNCGDTGTLVFSGGYCGVRQSPNGDAGRIYRCNNGVWEYTNQQSHFP